MFGLMVSGGMEWSGIKPHSIVGFVKKEWNGMGYNRTHSSKYHSFTQFSIPLI
jgi:hypothetical protein